MDYINIFMNPEEHKVKFCLFKIIKKVISRSE